MALRQSVVRTSSVCLPARLQCFKNLQGYEKYPLDASIRGWGIKNVLSVFSQSQSYLSLNCPLFLPTTLLRKRVWKDFEAKLTPSMILLRLGYAKQEDILPFFTADSFGNGRDSDGIYSNASEIGPQDVVKCQSFIVIHFQK